MLKPVIIADPGTSGSGYALLLGKPRQVPEGSFTWLEIEYGDVGDTVMAWFGPSPGKPVRSSAWTLPEATGPSEIVGIPSIFDRTEDKGDQIDALEIAAELGNASLSVRAAAQIEWSQRSAEDCARGVRLALSAGAHLQARRIATQGSQLYPEHPELRKMARILGAPRIVRTDVPPDPSVQANHRWLRSHAEEYQGLWVALRSGIPLAIAATAEELRSHLDDTDGVLITRVL